MKKYRKLLISASLLLAVAASALLLLRYVVHPPQAARLLPEGDTLIYANLRPLHLFDTEKPANLQLEQQYKDFIQQTGIQIERDLDEVAMSRQDTADGRDVESSEVFVGRFDRDKIISYFQKIAKDTEKYLDKTIISFPNDGHTIRLCILSNNMIAVTNMSSSGPMHRIVDRLASSGGPSLLEAHYSQVPTGSVAWMISRIPAKNGLELPGGMSFSFHQDAVAVASLRYAGLLLLRADFLTQSEDEARQVADSARTFLAISRSVGQSMGPRGGDKDVKAAFDSIQIEQSGSTTTISATIPQNVVKKMASGIDLAGNTPSGK